MTEPPLEIAPLGDRPEAVPVLAGWFAREWGDADPRNTVEAIARRLSEDPDEHGLPVRLLGLLAAKRGFTPLYLNTPRKEALYRRLGWEAVGRTIAGGKPAVVMRKHAAIAPAR